MKITKEDLIEGQKFWIWAFKNPTKGKTGYPEYEKLTKYHAMCPLCDIYCHSSQRCERCTLSSDGNGCFKPGSPFDIWNIQEGRGYSIETIKEAIQTIIEAYDTEIKKMEVAGRRNVNH